MRQVVFFFWMKISLGIEEVVCHTFDHLLSMLFIELYVRLFRSRILDFLKFQLYLFELLFA